MQSSVASRMIAIKLPRRLEVRIKAGWRLRAVQTAKEAVEAGLVALEKNGDAKGAIVLFDKALQMNPDDKEAGAAVYNIACCYAALKEWQKAADQVVLAVNDYRLDFSIPQNDPDMENLRQRPEWEAVKAQMMRGMTPEMKYNLISELRSPFRFFRFYVFGGLAVGSSIGLIFIIANLVKNITTGDSIQQPLQNLAINTIAIGVFSVFFYRDYLARSKERAKIEREETLSKLRVQKTGEITLSLAELRGTARPVIICGSKNFCRRSIDAARPYYSALKQRGVVVIPIILTEMDNRLKALQEDFKEDRSTGFGQQKSNKKQQRSHWEITPAGIEQWKKWLIDQKKYSGIEERDFYLQIQLNGSVKASGVGQPPWERFVSELPPLDDVRTKLTDNIGF